MKISPSILAVSVLACSLLASGCAPEAPVPQTTMPAATAPAATTQAPAITQTPVSPPPAAPPQPSLRDEIEISGPQTVGTTITIDAGRLEARLGAGLAFAWEQLFLPDSYSGTDYATGYAVELAKPRDSAISFRPEYPGNYRFRLTVTGANVNEKVQVDVPVTVSESPFEIKGIAYDMWHYTDELAYMSAGFAARARESGANLVMLSPTLYMASPSANDMSPCPPGVDKAICRGAMKDEDLVKMIREARAAGLQVMVKMILQVANPEGAWLEKKPSDWDEWFRNWTEVCLHYGAIAEKEGAEFFAVGSELREAAAYADKWRALIAEVRRVYSGQLTYGDNSISSGLVYGDYGYFQAWDALDYIGVHFYGPVTGVYGTRESNSPSVADMAAVFEKYLAEVLDPIVAKYHLPVIFMEFGTGSYDGTNIGHFNYNQTLDNAEQSEYYEAGLQAISGRDYVAGLNFWAYTWEPFDLSQRLTMSPIGKPSEQVIRYWFGAAR